MRREGNKATEGTGNVRFSQRMLLCAGLALWLAAPGLPVAPGAAAPAPDKDQERILPDGGAPASKDSGRLLPQVPAEETPLNPQVEPDAPQQEVSPDVPDQIPYEDTTGTKQNLEDIFSEDIPDFEPVELTEESARRALDVFEQVYGKFDDAEIAKYPTLQEFADKSPQGKKFAEIIRKHGFKSVREWNNVISNISFAYTSIDEGHDDEVLRQIKELEARKDVPKERKEKLLKYLRALVPSVNNRKVVQRLMADKAYAQKLNLLEGGGEGE